MVPSSRSPKIGVQIAVQRAGEVELRLVAVHFRRFPCYPPFISLQPTTSKIYPLLERGLPPYHITRGKTSKKLVQPRVVRPAATGRRCSNQSLENPVSQGQVTPAGTAARQRVAAFVFGMPGMAAHPAEPHVMPIQLHLQPLPEIPVLHRLFSPQFSSRFSSSWQSALFHRVPQVLRIGEQLHPRRARAASPAQRSQPGFPSGCSSSGHSPRKAPVHGRPYRKMARPASLPGGYRDRIRR